jgi:tRNA(adenine34) deaminase
LFLKKKPPCTPADSARELGNRFRVRSHSAWSKQPAGTTQEEELKEDIIHMPVGLFAQDPETIAASLASKEVSPQGPATGMRVLAFYITRTGRRLSASRLKKLEKARKLLSAQVEKAIKEEERRKIA